MKMLEGPWSRVEKPKWVQLFWGLVQSPGTGIDYNLTIIVLTIKGRLS